MSTTETMPDPTAARPPRNSFVHQGGDCFRFQHEQFTKFFESFLSQQSQDLNALRAAVAASSTAPHNDSSVSQLVTHIVSHYENYYETKQASAQRDVNPMFSPSWTSTTENIFMWVGGWRPSTAFQLLHSKSGMQLEARLEEIIRGGAVKDLGNVSAVQLQALDRLQRETVRAERVISEEAAEGQEALAASEVLQLVSSHDRNQMEPKMSAMKEQMGTVLARADKLRMNTIRGITDILKPIQAVHFLIAAAELHLAVHEYGKEKDRLVAEGVA